MINRTVTIRTTPEGAAVIRASLHHHALGIEPWAQMPDEDNARQALMRVRTVQSHVLEGIKAASAVEVAG